MGLGNINLVKSILETYSENVSNIFVIKYNMVSSIGKIKVNIVSGKAITVIIGTRIIFKIILIIFIS